MLHVTDLMTIDRCCPLCDSRILTARCSWFASAVLWYFQYIHYLIREKNVTTNFTESFITEDYVCGSCSRQKSLLSWRKYICWNWRNELQNTNDTWDRARTEWDRARAKSLVHRASFAVDSSIRHTYITKIKGRDGKTFMCFVACGVVVWGEFIDEARYHSTGDDRV